LIVVVIGLDYLSLKVEEKPMKSFKPIFLRCKLSTSVINQVISYQHLSNIIYRIILHNNKILK
jgi:hypothetical protein